MALVFDKEPKTGGGKFLKIGDGESVVGILRGTVLDYYVIWNPDKTSTIVPEGTPKAKFRFKVNFVTWDQEGNLEAKILEQGSTVYKALKELSQDYDLEKTAIKIKRTGSGQNNTEYSIVPLPKPPSEKMLEALKNLELLSLENESAAVTKPTEDDLPF